MTILEMLMFFLIMIVHVLCGGMTCLKSFITSTRILPEKRQVDDCENCKLRKNVRLLKSVGKI